MTKQHKTTTEQHEEPKHIEPEREDHTPTEPAEVAQSSFASAEQLKERDEPIPEASTAPNSQIPPQEKKKFDLKAFLHTKKGKVLCVLAILAVIVGVAFAVPVSRYAVAGLVVKKDATVVVADAETGKPVSAVDISLANQTVKTDANGKATLKNVPVGPWQVSAKKNYYQDANGSTLVPILSNQTTLQLKMQATGRQVPVKTINTLTGVALGGVEITAGDASVVTAEDGTGVLVLPADKMAISASLKRDGFNTVTADITVTDQVDDKNTFALTPSGKVYFLSKRTGKINVMKSGLDGANASVVVAGTGQEDESQTVLLASRDWKYLALQARRDSKAAKLYLVNTATDKLSVIDEGDDVDFSPVGWSNEYFIYRVTRNNLPSWQPKSQSLKSFNASDGKITTLDDTDGIGTGVTHWAKENFASSYIIDDHIVYTKLWYHSSSGLNNDKKNAIYRVKASGGDKQTLKDFDSVASSYIEAVLYRPDEIYFRLAGTPTKYYEYHDGTVTETTEVNDTNFYSQAYNTYLVSPSGKNTFWYEGRDGKNVLFVGGADGADGKEIMTSTSFKPYGWYTDDYLLLAKDGSELYILAYQVTGAEPVKITDYHKPAVNFPGYGYGYGGSH